MGLISNTNSDLLNLLPGAAPSAQSPAIASGTSVTPATGSFQELLLLFPSSDVAHAGQPPTLTPALEPMTSMMQSGSESLLMVTPTDLSNLRLFSQDGSLFTFHRSQQSSSPISLSELERLELAVAELQTMTLYVPPEASLIPASAPTADAELPQMLDVNSDHQFHGPLSDVAQQTLWNAAHDLHVFPGMTTADPAVAAAPRESPTGVQAMDFNAADTGQISAAQEAFSNQLVDLKKAVGRAASIDSNAGAVASSATDSVPLLAAGGNSQESAAVGSVVTRNAAAESLAGESLLQRSQVRSAPFVGSAAGTTATGAIPTITGGAETATSMVSSGAAEVVDAAVSSSLTPATDSLPPDADSSDGVRPAAVGISKQSAVVTTDQQVSSGEVAQPTVETAAASNVKTAAASAVETTAVSTFRAAAVPDHRLQSRSAVESSENNGEALESDSGQVASDAVPELQRLTEKSDGRSFRLGDGSEQRQQRGVVPLTSGAAVEAAIPGVFFRAASAALSAELPEPDLITAPASDGGLTTAMGEGIESSVTTVMPATSSSAVHRLLNPLEIAEQLATEVSRRLGVESSVVDGQERFTMRLDPPELGELVISMRRTASGIELHVEAADPATMNLIQNGIDQLKSDSERPGSIFQQLNINVTTSGHGSGHSADQRRPAIPVGTPDQAAGEVLESTDDRGESEQISFVA